MLIIDTIWTKRFQNVNQYYLAQPFKCYFDEIGLLLFSISLFCNLCHFDKKKIVQDKKWDHSTSRFMVSLSRLRLTNKLKTQSYHFKYFYGLVLRILGAFKIHNKLFWPQKYISQFFVTLRTWWIITLISIRKSQILCLEQPISKGQ